MPSDRRIFDRLRVFVSSRMEELFEERQAVRGALDALKVEAWIFEKDAGADTLTLPPASKSARIFTPLRPSLPFVLNGSNGVRSDYP